MPFESLIALATEKLRKWGFQPLDEGGGERHGAWEWTWTKLESPRRSYASLTRFEAVEGAYEMQVWAGADDGVHFGRYLIREFPHLAVVDLPNDQVKLIVGSLEDAAQRASGLSDTALTGTYLYSSPPRS